MVGVRLLSQSKGCGAMSNTYSTIVRLRDAIFVIAVVKLWVCDCVVRVAPGQHRA